MLENSLANLRERIDEIPFSYRGPVFGGIEARLRQAQAAAGE